MVKYQISLHSRRGIHLNGPLHWSPFKFMSKDKTQRSKRVTPQLLATGLIFNLTFSFFSVANKSGFGLETQEHFI